MKKTGTPAAAATAWPWRVPVSVDDVPESGRHLEIAASADACAAVAELAGVNSVTDLKAAVDLEREGDGVHVSGRVTARVGQTCVVTLEPIENAIDEPIDMAFAPAPAKTAAPQAAGARRQPMAEEDLPEPLVNGVIDLGAIATEFLILGIDPHPRKSDVVFTPPAVEDDTPHPFAALEALKKQPGGGGN